MDLSPGAGLAKRGNAGDRRSYVGEVNGDVMSCAMRARGRTKLSSISKRDYFGSSCSSGSVANLRQKMLWLCVLGARAAHETPRVVVVVTCSAHYTDFLENWLAWLQRLKLDEEVGLVAIAEDVQACVGPATV